MKKHKILGIALIGYFIMGIYSFEMLQQALKTTSYYLVEMIQILPAVFVLTALLQTWVPTSVIMKYVGKDAGIKGIAISFAIGSLSAGPIYAAFPVCKTLLKKGASLNNIVIILSAWAVVKVPMLINEVKFMGMSYMLIRWLLTVIAIMILAKLMEKLVKHVTFQEHQLTINKHLCIGCKRCIQEYPDLFGIIDDQIVILSTAKLEAGHQEICPVGAIS